MPINLENIQEKLRRLNHKQQQQVMAFIESLEPASRVPDGKRFSFVGIARSGNDSLSTDTESILDDAADRRED